VTPQTKTDTSGQDDHYLLQTEIDCLHRMRRIADVI